MLGVAVIGLGMLFFNGMFVGDEKIKTRAIVADYDNTVYDPEETDQL